MSEILLATNPNNPQIVGSYKPQATDEEKATQLPKPSGYHILCVLLTYSTFQHFTFNNLAFYTTKHLQ